MMKVCIITGASSGIGRAAAENMLKRGYKVYGISRRGGDIDNVVSLCADVTDEQEIIKAVDTVMAESGRIDVLINNANPAPSRGDQNTKARFRGLLNLQGPRTPNVSLTLIFSVRSECAGLCCRLCESRALGAL